MKTSLCDGYTDEEFSKLGEVLAANDCHDSPRWWLETFDNYAQYKWLLERLDMPIENVPLHINDDNFFNRIIALWRLKIGR